MSCPTDFTSGNTATSCRSAAKIRIFGTNKNIRKSHGLRPCSIASSCNSACDDERVCLLTQSCCLCVPCSVFVHSRARSARKWSSSLLTTSQERRRTLTVSTRPAALRGRILRLRQLHQQGSFADVLQRRRQHDRP